MGDMKGKADKKPLTSAEKRERARARRAEREARRRAREEAWKEQVAAHFGYLETVYDFHFAKVDGSNWWETFARYESDSLAVKVAYSAEFVCVEVFLIRLVDGKIPEYPIFINPGTPIKHVMLDFVLGKRAPEEAETLRRELGGLSEEQVERSLAFQARALRRYCDDILRGDFTILDVIADDLHQRAREHPQEIRVVLPDTAQPGDEAPLVEELRKNHPQQPIRVEHYRTKRRASRRKDAQGATE